jgi:hypothetical protein
MLLVDSDIDLFHDDGRDVVNLQSIVLAFQMPIHDGCGVPSRKAEKASRVIFKIRNISLKVHAQAQVPPVDGIRPQTNPILGTNALVLLSPPVDDTAPYCPTMHSARRTRHGG